MSPPQTGRVLFAARVSAYLVQIGDNPWYGPRAIRSLPQPTANRSSSPFSTAARSRTASVDVGYQLFTDQARIESQCRSVFNGLFMGKHAANLVSCLNLHH